MKKNIFTLSILAVAALALFSCAKVETEIQTLEETKGVPFEIYAGSAETKTSNADNDISWVVNDAINLFHAEHGATSYSANDQFTITSENLASNKFTGTLSAGALDPSKSYDWYALYPYSSYITTPNNTSSGYLGIGSADADTPQVQAGNNSMAHLSGQYFPLYGKQEDVDAADAPSVTLKPALAVMKIRVTNKKAADLVVKSIAVVAPEDIVGQYYIKFIGDAAVFAGKSSATSKTAKLNVTSGDAIAENAYADFYIAVKPFTAAVDSKLTIVVNGYSKTVTLTSAFSFAEGKVSQVSFDYNAPDYDQLVYSYLNITGSSYVNWSGIKGTYSNAVYAGRSYVNDNNYIQINTTSPAGIVSTTSGGSLNKVAVTWSSNTTDGRKVFVYGRNTPYTSASELYDANTAGTKIGEIVKGTSTEVTATDYYAYIGIIANGGALYLDNVNIHWGAAKTPVSAPTDVTATVSGTTINVSWKDVTSNVGSYIVTCSGQAPQVIAQGTKAASFTSLANDTYTITVQAVPSDVTLASGTYSYSDVVTTSATVTAAVVEVWQLTDLADIEDTDVFVIVGTNAYGSYALPHTNGNTSAPGLVEVTITEGKLSGAVADGIKWNVSGNNTDGYIFYPNGSTTTWLYNTNSNNGVRVGTTTSTTVSKVKYDDINKYTLDGTHLKNVGLHALNDRYLSIYINGTTPTDWRTYTNTDNAPTMTFYVLQ